MGRQGKMHGSPFHVESPQYRYAIEHEYTIQSTPVKCDNLSERSGHCNLWNIEYTSCTSHRCKYYRVDLQRTNTCLDCAYSYEKKCFHPKHPIKNRFDVNAAHYCSYFYGLETGEEYFYVIRNFCKRIALTKLVESHQQKIQSKTRYIHRAKEKLSDPKITAANKAYLEANIKRKTAKQLTAQKKLEQYLAEFSDAGGPLKSIPSQFSSI